MRGLLLPGLTLTLCAQAPIPLATTITRVRVHPDEAWITRAGRHAFEQAGTYRLRIQGLPPGLRIQDLRVAAKGPEGTRLGDVALRSEPALVTETGGWKTLQQERERLLQRQEDLEAEGEGLAQETSFLKQLLAQHREELGSRLAYATPKAETVVDLSKGLQERIHALLARDKARLRELQGAKEELGRHDALMRQRASERQSAPMAATIELSLPRNGRVDVELSYRSARSRWEPVYEARLSPDRKELELVLFAAIRQQSGESWEGVALEIAHARAGQNLAPLKYDGGETIAWYDYPAQRGAPHAASAVVEVVAAPSTYDGGSASSRTPTFAPEPRPVTALEAQAALRETSKGLATLYVLEGGKDVPSDGEPHRFRVLSAMLSPELAPVATPRLDPTVYQVARFTLPASLPLYPGAPIVHFVGSQRLGDALLAKPAPGEPFQLAFGPYQGLEVDLRRLEARRDTVGAFTKDRLWTLRERIEIANAGEEAHRVEIYDRILSSGDDKVRISPLPESTPGIQIRPGVRQWTLDLAPHGKASIQLAQQIRGPQEGYFAGLEGLQLP